MLHIVLVTTTSKYKPVFNSFLFSLSHCQVFVSADIYDLKSFGYTISFGVLMQWILTLINEVLLNIFFNTI